MQSTYRVYGATCAIRCDCLSISCPYEGPPRTSLGFLELEVNCSVFAEIPICREATANGEHSTTKLSNEREEDG
jgi:hypothetical protein